MDTPAAVFFATVTLVLFTAPIITPAKGFSVAGKTYRGGLLETDNKQSLLHNTPETDRELPLVTTAPPFSGHNHHTPFKALSQYVPHHQSQEDFSLSRGIKHYLFRDLASQLIPHEDTAPFFEVTTSSPAIVEIQRYISEKPSATTTTESLTSAIMITSAPTPCHKREQPGSAHMSITLLTKDVEAQNSKKRQGKTGSDGMLMRSESGVQDYETTTTTVITTTTQTPAMCNNSFRAPGGYIKTPPPSSRNSNINCTFTVTVYVGYGVEIQMGDYHRL